MRRQNDRSVPATRDRLGQSAPAGVAGRPAGASSPRSLLLPLVLGLLGAPASTPRSCRGDELTDAKAQAGRSSRRRSPSRRRRSRSSTRCSAASPPRSRNKRRAARRINADLTAVRRRSRRWQAQIEEVKASTTSSSPSSRDGRPAGRDRARRRCKRAELRERQALLAERVRRPTTPTGRRCSRRSCRAGRSPTCSPR